MPQSPDIRLVTEARVDLLATAVVENDASALQAAIVALIAEYAPAGGGGGDIDWDALVASGYRVTAYYNGTTWQTRASAVNALLPYVYTEEVIFDSQPYPSAPTPTDSIDGDFWDYGEDVA